MPSLSTAPRAPLPTAPRVLIVSYDLARKLGRERAARFYTVIADESHNLKAGGSLSLSLSLALAHYAWL